MAFDWLKKIIPSKNDRELKKMQPMVDRINSLESGIKKLDDTQLAAKTPPKYPRTHVQHVLFVEKEFDLPQHLTSRV